MEMEKFYFQVNERGIMIVGILYSKIIRCGGILIDKEKKNKIK